MNADPPEAHKQVHVSVFPNVLIAFGFIAFDAIISLTLGLRLSRSLLISAARCFCQLQLMSTLLARIFETKDALLVALLATALNLLGAREVVFNKAARRHSGMFAVTLVSLIASTVPISAVASRFAMNIQPWWQPERYVPTLGMILGNAISGVGIGVGRTLEEFHTSRDKVETMLAMGASRSEACRGLVVDSLRLALLPTINQMSVIGLISFPGMMTGAMLGGASVEQAALLQTIIIFTISSSVVLATLISVLATCTILVDSRGRIHSQRAWSTKGGMSVAFSVKQYFRYQPARRVPDEDSARDWGRRTKDRLRAIFRLRPPAVQLE